ncbi:MAG: putative nucleotidyltransferase substrate binding domain-containing protein [Alysiella sp.]|uniref:putative nucleotidyltransferase substrate binding domain-containing protein n=1 Tax=Alysiella sp. TaxID=1872483 RepID=UPI0026DBB913|nr:putative nucleotidyltransferase substrate binding domain-containing protein [Alysiella sp.]MDO4433797.1 putative nucleotidyltransferase substrate binding domain-containing protein [Alysiella sp.]
MERFDFSFAPYANLNHVQRQMLQASVDIVFFNDDEVIIQPQQKIEHLYVVIKGAIKELNPEGEVLAVYRERDTFDARALIEGSSQHQFITAEQALVYSIPKATVQKIIEDNPRFGAYFYASVADKFANLNNNELDGLFTAHVRDAYRKNAVWLDGSDSIFTVAQKMKEHKSKSVLIKHNQQVGLLTESVFRDLLLQNGSPQDPAHQWATFNLISIDINDFVFNALLKMMQYYVQRVAVVENGEVIGVLEQVDVLAYLSNHSHLVAQRLERATTLDDLAGIAEQMTQSIFVLRNNGLRAPQLAQLMQVLNGSLFEKAWRMIAPPELYEQSCLIVMGSEGRGEQVLKTDQDNALILSENADLEMAKQAALKFSELLEKLGYPPCKGNIMVSNEMWRKTLPEFKKMVGDWARKASGENMMNLAIFLDARVVAGNPAYLEEVNEYLRQFLNNDVGMLMAFARAVEQFDGDGQGFFSKLLHRNDKEKMDVKKMGLFPVVHGIRALSLEYKINETNTFERIQRLAQAGVLEQQFAQDLAEAQRYLMDMRLKAGLACLHEGKVTAPNQLDIDSLSTLERDLLKDALQVVKRFKNIIRMHFRLNA